MPHRTGLPDGIIATWGGITLKPLDPQSIKILADGKSPKKGLLIDYLGDLARSAKEGLPIYRIEGGPGFVWAASFGLRARGTLRVVAADTNGLIALPPEQQPTAQSATIPTAAETNPPESGQGVDQLQTEITTLTSKIAELEKAAAIAAEAAAGEAQARVDAELSKRMIEQTAVTEKAKLEGTIARLQADRAATDAKAGWRQSALPGTIGGLVGALTTCAVGFFVTRRKANASKQPVWEPGKGPIDLSNQSQNGTQEAVPHVVSPEIIGAETAVGLESGEKAGITATPPASTVCIPAGERLEAAGEVSAPRPS
jgi:outer membrane murein-binding lipoprotein Lpp